MWVFRLGKFSPATARKQSVRCVRIASARSVFTQSLADCSISVQLPPKNMIPPYLATRTQLFWLLVLVALAGCGSRGAPKVRKPPSVLGPQLQCVDGTSSLLQPTEAQRLVLFGAQNEWLSFAVQVSSTRLQRGGQSAVLQISDLSGGQHAIASSQFSGFQVLPMSVDLNRAGLVRHTGLPVTSKSTLLRALLPMNLRSGCIELADAR